MRILIAGSRGDEGRYLATFSTTTCIVLIIKS